MLNCLHGLNENFLHRLALYVYEYLLHVGAQKAAQTFLSEVIMRYNFVVSCISHMLLSFVDKMGEKHNIR